jgi:hypothetical protein
MGLNRYVILIDKSINVHKIQILPTNMSSPDVTKEKGRPGLKAGRSNEFTLLLPLKPGGANRLRSKMADTFRAQNQTLVDRVGTVRDLRFGIFDQDSRLLFASTFDGDWDQFINDFTSNMPDQLDYIFGEVQDFPGIQSPDVKEWILRYQIPAQYFYSAYPDASVKDVWKALKIKSGLDVVLDELSS